MTSQEKTTMPIQSRPAHDSSSSVWARHFEERIGSDLEKFVLKRWVYNRPIFETIQRRLPSGGAVLEFGSGSGTYSACLARFGYNVTGVDVDPAMVEMANHLAEEMGAKNARFIEGSILDLSMYYGKFDLAYSSGVIEHFYHEDAVEVVRQAGLCAPHVLITVPSHWQWRKVKSSTEGIFEAYTMRRLRRVVREAGLVISEELAYSAGNKLGRAVELLVPPLVAPFLFKHLASTIGVLCRRP